MSSASILVFHRSGPEQRELGRWVRVLEELHAAIERCEPRTEEAPWRWGGRSLVSFLTAAVWLGGGIALEEPPITRKDPADRRRRVHGRADLWADLNGTRFSVEAKVVEASLGSRRAAKTRLLSAISDARHTTEEHADHRVALRFVSWTGTGADRAQAEADRDAWFGEAADCAREQGAGATLCAVHLTPDPTEARGWGYGVAMALT